MRFNMICEGCTHIDRRHCVRQVEATFHVLLIVGQARQHTAYASQHHQINMACNVSGRQQVCQDYSHEVQNAQTYRNTLGSVADAERYAVTLGHVFLCLFYPFLFYCLFVVCHRGPTSRLNWFQLVSNGPVQSVGLNYGKQLVYTLPVGLISTLV